MTAQQSKNSLLCPNCRRLISRDEPQCPYCGIRRPASWWKNNRLIAGLSHQDKIISIIIYTNIGFYILSLVLFPRSSGLALNPLSFLSPSHKSLLVLGSTGTVAILELHRWWSLVSANYLHGGLLHILFNMMALRQIGPLVVREYGVSRMLAIYTLGGVGGFLLSFLAGVRFTIGASAAVCGLIGAILYYGKSRGGIYGRNLFSQIGGWAITIFVFGLIVPGINNWGHGGGMAAGALLGFLLGYREKKRENIRHKFLGASCVILTATVLAWAALSSIFYVFVI
ncbi:MAG: rhomboid family intramembrane serine protease [Desulfobulbaceae bacterium]|nr:rhomboid family intramembrane serine protease [Desulfobulbaceae bacterium]